MYCRNCGSNNREEATYCDKCGTQLINNQVIIPEPKKKNNSVIIIIIIAIVGVLIILGAVAFALATIFFDMPWETVKQNNNYEWGNIEKEQDLVNPESEVTEEDTGCKEDIDLDTESITSEESILETIKDGKVAVYLFRGQGCPHCTEAETWFESIKGEYGNKFVLIDYEVWYNQENAELMQKVAKSRGEEVLGVPYIIIGNKSWNGFTQSYESEMLSEIKNLSE